MPCLDFFHWPFLFFSAHTCSYSQLPCDDQVEEVPRVDDPQPADHQDVHEADRAGAAGLRTGDRPISHWHITASGDVAERAVDKSIISSFHWQYYLETGLHCVLTGAPTKLFLNLQISALAISPFFVENVGDLQLTSLRLVTNVSWNIIRSI